MWLWTVMIKSFTLSLITSKWATSPSEIVFLSFSENLQPLLLLIICLSFHFPLKIMCQKWYYIYRMILWLIVRIFCWLLLVITVNLYFGVIDIMLLLCYFLWRLTMQVQGAEEFAWSVSVSLLLGSLFIYYYSYISLTAQTIGWHTKFSGPKFLVSYLVNTKCWWHKFCRI